MSDTITRMQAVFGEALSLAQRKNADYGDAWKDQGWRGNLSRVFEKDKRLRTILWNGDKVDIHVREGVRETAIDMMNTLAFFVMNHDAGVEWGHEQPFWQAANPFDYEPGEYEAMNQASSPMPTEATQDLIREGLAAAEQTGELPVRVPGEELAVDQAEEGGRKPSPTRRTQRPK